MEHLTTVLRSNASLVSLNLTFSAILEEEQPRSCRVRWNVVHFSLVEYIFGGTEFARAGVWQSRGNKCWGSLGTSSYVIHLIENWFLTTRGLHEDGDAGLVYAKLRARDDDIDLVVMEQLENTDRVPPNSSWNLPCGNENIGMNFNNIDVNLQIS